MGYKILISKKVKKQLDKLSQNEQTVIARSIEKLIFFSKKSKNIKKLKTPFFGFRKRVGNYRILFEVIFKDKEIRIYKIGHRQDIYKK